MARAFQKIRFRLYHWPRWLLDLPFAALLAPASQRTALDTYKGITIAGASFGRAHGTEFLKRTIEALELVSRFDERRFKRIQQEIRFIINAELGSGADYRRVGRFCCIDYARYDFARDHDWYLRCYAAALVHEATHGAIYSRYIGYTRSRRLRIERLCHTEELRFLGRLDTPDRLWSEQVVGPFDEQYYLQYHRAGLLSRFRTIRHRIAEVRSGS